MMLKETLPWTREQLQGREMVERGLLKLVITKLVLLHKIVTVTPRKRTQDPSSICSFTHGKYFRLLTVPETPS